MSDHADIGTVEPVNVALTSSYRWKIKNFRYVSVHSGSSLLSPEFTTAGSNVKWLLKLYPNGKTDIDSDYLSISVYYCSEIETNATYEISIVNVENQMYEDLSIIEELKLVADFESRSEAWVAHKFHPRLVEKSFIKDPINNVLSDDCLTIWLEVIVQNPIISNSSDNDMKDDRLKEFDDFGKLLDNEQFSDVTFVVGDQKIHAHKAILATRNSVFKDMLDHSARDQDRKTVIEIVDIEYRVLKELFRFLYMGTVNNVYRMADNLFVAANEYGVEGMSIFCQKTLCSHLKDYNVLQILVIADIRDAKLLRQRALDFIVDHANEIVERQEFTSLRPDLMQEIVRVMARKKMITESE